MNGAQRIIKVCGILFAVLLSFSIISSIVAAVAGIGAIAIYSDNKVEDVISFSNEYTGIDSIYIDAAAANIAIVKGDTFKVDALNVPDAYKILQDGTTLKVTVKNIWYVGNNEGSKLTIYVPTEISSLDMDVAAGDINVDGIVVKAAKIKAGVGRVVFNNTDITNLELKAGVGQTIYNGSLKGKCRIECGVGETNIALTNGEQNYTLNLDKGLGNISVNGKSVSDEHTEGTGINEINIEGGVGSISVNY